VTGGGPTGGGPGPPGAVPGARPRAIAVSGDLDAADAARAARELARAVGLGPTAAQQVATAVSELATNAVKYAYGAEVVLEPAEDEDRRGIRVTVSDAGPGIADPVAAMREGRSTGGTLGLGLPAARRLMDDFALETSPAGTIVRMARWIGRAATPAGVAWAAHAGLGGVPLMAPMRNGVLFAVAAGARAETAVRAWRTAPWRGPGVLAGATASGLGTGERLGAAIAAQSALDGRLEWLAAGDATAAIVRGGRVLRAVPGAALGSGGGGAAGVRAAVVDLRRDDVLVLVATRLGDEAVRALAAEQPTAGAAWLVARFLRGTTEPGRPGPDRSPDRREGGGGGLVGRSRLDAS
jgi:serine/threonine-protein kinase RsbT